MDDSCFISIIIPVYNVVQYLRACVDSILLQSFEDYEIILVDDGSVDGSSDLCDEYAKRDNRIIVFHKENSGASEARNAGMRAAKGKYLYFIDADDYLAEGSLDIIVDQMKTDGESDIFLLRSIDVLTDGSLKGSGYKYDKNKLYKKNRMEVLAYFSRISMFPVPPWIKLIRRQFLEEKNIYFTKGLHCCNDLDHMMGLILHAESYSYCDFPVYYYRCYREGSLSGSSSYRLVSSLLHVIDKWYCITKKDYDEYAPYIYNLLADQYTSLLWYYYSLDKSKKTACEDEVKKYAFLMSKSSSRNIRLTGIIYKLFGLQAVSGFVNFYYNYILRKKR